MSAAFTTLAHRAECPDATELYRCQGQTNEVAHLRFDLSADNVLQRPGGSLEGKMYDNVLQE